MSQNPVNVTLVTHITEVIYVVGSLQWTRIYQNLCWSAHTTVDWSLGLGETCRRQVPGRRRLQMGTGLLYVPIPFSQLTVAEWVGRMKCLWYSKPCPDSSYLATVECILPVSVNTSGLYDFPGCHSALGWCAISSYMKSYLTPTSL